MKGEANDMTDEQQKVILAIAGVLAVGGLNETETHVC